MANSGYRSNNDLIGLPFAYIPLVPFVFKVLDNV